MIYGVTGLLGGGKSYGAVVDMVKHLRRGVVASNIQLDLEQVSKINKVPVDVLESRYHFIDVDMNPDCWSWPRGDARGTRNQRKVLVVIDEAGEWFSNLEKSSLKAFTSWLRQSDKRGQDVYLIVQDASILAKQGRVLVHRWLKMRNMSAWKMPALGWSLPPPWRYEFHRIEFDATGRNRIGKPQISMRDKRIFQTYCTGAMVGSSAAASLEYSNNAYDAVLEESKEEKTINLMPLYLGVTFWGAVLWLIVLKV